MVWIGYLQYKVIYQSVNNEVSSICYQKRMPLLTVSKLFQPALVAPINKCAIRLHIDLIVKWRVCLIEILKRHAVLQRNAISDHIT